MTEELKQFQPRLESGPVFLVQRGMIRGEDVQRLVNHVPGSIALMTHDVGCVRVIDTAPEPVDRIAGLISEDV